jgi:hypothetical protein
MYAHACCEKSQMRSMLTISLEKYCRNISLKFDFPLFVFKGCLQYKFLFAHPQEYSIPSPASSQCILECGQQEARPSPGPLFEAWSLHSKNQSSYQQV